jgi:hypothetical protein
VNEIVNPDANAIPCMIKVARIRWVNLLKPLTFLSFQQFEKTVNGF